MAAFRASTLALLVALTVSACATSAALRSGRSAEQRQEYDLAVVEYTKALQRNPNDRSARQALDRVKLRSAQEHYSRARRLYTVSKLDEALVEFQLAA
jgi:tetratricopeptide (TPR) repeat protein